MIEMRSITITVGLIVAIASSVSGCAVSTPKMIPDTTTSETIQSPTQPITVVTEPLSQTPTVSANESIQYTFKPDWWLESQTYGMFNYWNDTDIDRLKNTGSNVNGYRLVFDLDLINPNFDIAGDIKKVHDSGRKYVVGITFNGIIEKWPEETSLLASQGALGLTYDGVPTVQDAGERVYYFSTNHPAWQAALIQQGKRIVDAKADGIAVIEPWGASFYPGFNGQPDFSDVSLAGFGNYLASQFDSVTLSAWGIDKPDTLDYRNYLHDRGVKQSDLQTAPFYNEYCAYQRQLSAEFFSHYITEVKSYARERGITDFPIATAQHGGWLTPYTLGMLQAADFAFGNLDFADLENVYDVHAFQYKLHRAVTDGPLIAAPMDMSLGWLVQNSSNADNWLMLKAAEAYVNQGGFHDTYHAGLTQDGPLEYNANPTAIRQIFDFVTTNSELFVNNNQSCSKIAVLLVQEAISDDTDTHWNTFVGVCRVLSTANLQYDVVLKRQNPADRATLIHYDVVILPGCSNLNQGTLSWLSQYLALGGRLVTINQSPEELRSSSGTIPLHLDWYPDINRGSVSNQEFLNIVRASLSKVLLAEALPEGVIAQAWENDSGCILHLLNYDFSTVDGIQEKLGFRVVFAPSLGVTPTSVTLFSPDLPGPMPLDFGWDGVHLIFEIPSLRIWDAVVIQ